MSSRVPTAIEVEAGEHLVRLTGEVPGACQGCVFRRGTEANQTGETVMAAIQCVFTGETFYCHAGVESDDPTRPCAGWLQATEKARGGGVVPGDTIADLARNTVAAIREVVAMEPRVVGAVEMYVFRAMVEAGTETLRPISELTREAGYVLLWRLDGDEWVADFGTKGTATHLGNITHWTPIPNVRVAHEGGKTWQGPSSTSSS